MKPTESAVKPWSFIPLLYIMQAIPVTLVQEVATVVYKDFGIANAPITQWTSLIAIPWSLQLLLGPLVDLNSTKRKWILGGQAVISGGLALAPLALQLPNAFEISLAILFITALFSAMCNIATDGFYLIAMPKEEQAAFAGVQTTSYRMGRLFCNGVLVYAAGHLTSMGLSKPVAWTATLFACAVLYVIGYFINLKTVPMPEADVPVGDQNAPERNLNFARTGIVLALGVGAYFTVGATWRLLAHLIWVVRDGVAEGPLKGWALLDPDPKILGFSSHLPAVTTEVIQLAVCGAAFLFGLGMARRLLRGSPMADAFVSYVRQPGIVPILAFLLFYRFGEAMVVKMSPLFLKDSFVNGGLAVDNEQLGLIKGFAGVGGIIVGGLAGGWIVSRLGLRRSFWPLAILMHLPNLLYVWASQTRPPVWSLFIVDFVDQFGYGFGYAGYMIYLMFVAQRGNFKTSHYAIGTGLGALFISVAGVMSGILQSNFGYHGFFIAAIFLTLPGMVTLLFIPMEDSKPTSP